MFDLAHGLGMFFMGCTITIIGFFIAYTVATRTQKKSKELSEVEKSIQDLKTLNQDTIDSISTGEDIV